MQQIYFRDGWIETREAPEPSPGEGEVLVAIARCCLTAPFSVVSVSGIVRKTGAGVTGLFIGAQVACCAPGDMPLAGLMCLPEACVVPTPMSMGLDAAAIAGCGAVALRGVRRADPMLGECFIVAGLGLIGRLTARLLRVNGCGVIGCDPDPVRIGQAREKGMADGFVCGTNLSMDTISHTTGGIGADGVIVTSNIPKEIVTALLRMCRVGARIVFAGAADADIVLSGSDRKEFDSLIAGMYGPEVDLPGSDSISMEYPVSYVRWTGRRNMEEFLARVADGSIPMDSLIGGVYPVDRVAEAYGAAKNVRDDSPAVLLSFPVSGSVVIPVADTPDPSVRIVPARPIRIALAGAGAFAKGMHLPNIVKQPSLFTLRAIQSRTPENAEAAARETGAGYSATDFRSILDDKTVDAVFVTTRHNLHAGMTLDALKAGKHVFVEKPLAVSPDELDAVRKFYENIDVGGAPLLMTGFNRRFSPIACRIRELTKDRVSPMILNYRMNAGCIPPDHWVHTVEGGGRNIGEACHIYDLFTFLIDAGFRGVEARSIRPVSGTIGSRDNFTATVTFADGSLATLTYTALGSPNYPKEQLEIFCEGMTLVMKDYASLTVYGAANANMTGAVDKGHAAELTAFGEALLSGGSWPIPLWQQCQAMDIAFEVERQLGD